MKNYFRQVIVVSSLIFMILVGINLLFNREVILTIIDSQFVISLLSGLLTILFIDDERRSNQQVIIREIIYIISILIMVMISNFWFKWELGFVGLFQNLILIIIIYLFIKGFIYDKDQKEADKINQYLKDKRKQKEEK